MARRRAGWGEGLFEELAANDAHRIRDYLEHKGWRIFDQRSIVLQRPRTNMFMRVNEKGMPMFRCTYYLAPGITLTFYQQWFQAGPDDDFAEWCRKETERGGLCNWSPTFKAFVDWYEVRWGWVHTPALQVLRWMAGLVMKNPLWAQEQFLEFAEQPEPQGKGTE